MRPSSIVYFERVVLAAIGFNLLESWMNWDQTVSKSAAIGNGIGFIVATLTIYFATILVLLWFVSRKGSQIAKWVYVVLNGSAIIFTFTDIRNLIEEGGATNVVTTITYALLILSLLLLFRHDARAWFDGGRKKGPDWSATRRA